MLFVETEYYGYVPGKVIILVEINFGRKKNDNNFPNRSVIKDYKIGLICVCCFLDVALV